MIRDPPGHTLGTMDLKSRDILRINLARITHRCVAPIVDNKIILKKTSVLFKSWLFGCRRQGVKHQILRSQLPPQDILSSYISNNYMYPMYPMTKPGKSEKVSLYSGLFFLPLWLSRCQRKSKVPRSVLKCATKTPMAQPSTCISLNVNNLRRLIDRSCATPTEACGIGYVSTAKSIQVPNRDLERVRLSGFGFGY